MKILHFFHRIKDSYIAGIDRINSFAKTFVVARTGRAIADNEWYFAFCSFFQKNRVNLENPYIYPVEMFMNHSMTQKKINARDERDGLSTKSVIPGIWLPFTPPIFYNGAYGESIPLQRNDLYNFSCILLLLS